MCTRPFGNTKQDCKPQPKPKKNKIADPKTKKKQCCRPQPKPKKRIRLQTPTICVLVGSAIFCFLVLVRFAILFFGFWLGSAIFPQTVVTLRGSYGRSQGLVLIEVLALGVWFRLHRNAVLKFHVGFDCAGSRKIGIPKIAISKASFYRVFVYVFGHELHFAWQVQLAVCQRLCLRRNAVLRFYVGFDCAGSHKVVVPNFTISKASFFRVFLHVFGHELHFAWQAQGIRHMWKSET